MKDKELKIFFCYEEGYGGGAFAMQSIHNELKKNKNIRIYCKRSKPPKNWKFYLTGKNNFKKRRGQIGFIHRPISRQLWQLYSNQI
jgi:hypothetical protein